MKKIAVIVGARPQFIKHAHVQKTLSKKYDVFLIHTGQHYDDSMSGKFFRDLDIPSPDVDLGIGSGPQGEQTGRMLEAIERELLKDDFDYVLVYGDTNSSLAGALAASKLCIPLIHIESGLRSFDITMPEEVNRILIDRTASVLYAPTDAAITNLLNENIDGNKIRMYDVVRSSTEHNLEIARKASTILSELSLRSGRYFVSTFHRKSNVDSEISLSAIVDALTWARIKTVVLLHPGTKQKLSEYGLLAQLEAADNIVLSEPIGYLDTLSLVDQSAGVITDSGGLQHEADIMGIPCITLRHNTEWVESLGRKNELVGDVGHLIIDAIKDLEKEAKYGQSKKRV